MIFYFPPVSALSAFVTVIKLFIDFHVRLGVGCTFIQHMRLENRFSVCCFPLSNSFVAAPDCKWNNSWNNSNFWDTLVGFKIHVMMISSHLRRHREIWCGCIYTAARRGTGKPLTVALFIDHGFPNTVYLCVHPYWVASEVMCMRKKKCYFFIYLFNGIDMENCHFINSQK